MKDLQTKGTGNSRYLKSAIGATATWEEARALLVNGTFPVDLAGINEAGILQIGDALNKATLLSDETAIALGGDATMVPNEAFVALLQKIANLTAEDVGASRIQTGTYAGTGKYGSGNKTTLSLSFAAKLIVVIGEAISDGTDSASIGIILPAASRGASIICRSSNGSYQVESGGGLVASVSGNNVSFYATKDAIAQLNYSGKTYNYVACG